MTDAQASRTGAAGARQAIRFGGRSGRDRGFTLLEMLVALAVMAALVGLVPRIFVAARANIDRSQAWLDAGLVAQAVLNEELAGRDLRPGIRRGHLEGRAWTAVLRPNPTLSARGAEGNRVLLDVRVTVAVSASDALALETMRIGYPR